MAVELLSGALLGETSSFQTAPREQALGPLLGQFFSLLVLHSRSLCKLVDRTRPRALGSLLVLFFSFVGLFCSARPQALGPL